MDFSHLTLEVPRQVSTEGHEADEPRYRVAFSHVALHKKAPWWH